MFVFPSYIPKHTNQRKPFSLFCCFNFQFYSKANSTNSNVVRVAPRPKNPSSAYNYNLANSFPATTYSANFYPNTSNFPSYHVNSLNYPNYPSNDIPPATVTGAASVGGGINGSGANTVAYNPFLVKNSKAERKAISAMEKKFNSLKSIGIKKSPQFYSMRVNKCKRHHSGNNGQNGGPHGFGGEPHQMLLANSTVSGAQTNTVTNSMPYMSSTSSSSQSTSNGGKHFDTQQQPLYENLTDSIQIHESSLHNESSFASVLDEFNCEPERNSIYRSDSGISNSSYECITPVPAPRTNQRKCQSAPVYMNLPNHNNSSSSAYHQRSNGGRMSGKGGGGGGISANKGSNHHHQVKHNSKCKNSLQNGGAALSYEVCVAFFHFFPVLILFYSNLYIPIDT